MHLLETLDQSKRIYLLAVPYYRTIYLFYKVMIDTLCRYLKHSDFIVMLFQINSLIFIV